MSCMLVGENWTRQKKFRQRCGNSLNLRYDEADSFPSGVQSAQTPRPPDCSQQSGGCFFCVYMVTRFSDLFESIFLPIAGINIPILG